MQADFYSKLSLENCEVSQVPIPLAEIASTALLFIGAGGTMSGELAILGVPTISIYEDKLLSVDQHLIDQGIFRTFRNLTRKNLVKW